MHPLKKAALKRKIAAYAVALVNESWSGGGDPEDIPLREEELNEAKKQLEKYIDSL